MNRVKFTTMRLRLIIMLLAILAFLSAAFGGYIYYASTQVSLFNKAEQEAMVQTAAIANRFSSFLSEQLKTVKALAGLKEIRNGFSGQPGAIAAANRILDHFEDSLAVDVCYLMDRTGTTIASSNRDDPDSFVGKNFAFRPYFKQAIQGMPATYMALGTTSGKRGVYYSHPVYTEEDQPPAGIVVIKTSVAVIENEFSESSSSISLLADPHGIIFISSYPPWLFHSLWQLPAAETAQIAATMQFGSGPWQWTGLTRAEANQVYDRLGHDYLIFQREIRNFPGWQVVYLQRIPSHFKSILVPLLKTTGSLILPFLVLIGAAVFLLYKQASSEIARRKSAETALRASEKRYRTLYHNTPAMLHSIDPGGRMLSVSDYWTEVLGYGREEVIGRQFTDFMTDESRRYALETVLPGFLRNGFCKNIAYRFVKKNGELIDVLLSAIAERDEQGAIRRSLAVLLDVTEQKRTAERLEKARQELSRYSKELESQVRERTREISNILKYTPAMVYIKDKAGRYRLVNSRFEELFGRKNDAVQGLTDYDLLSQEVADQFRSNDLRVITEKRAVQVEESFPQNTGVHTYLSVKFPLYDEAGAVTGVCGIATDITEVKKAQNQLRRLSGGIMANQEKERSAIARELHDELGQILTALRMDAVWIQERLKESDPKAAERALTMCNLIDRTIADVRSIAIRLRPGVLDDLGLVDALDWFTGDFEKRTGITCVFERRNIPMISDAVATAAYRIAQEALTNVARHAEATQVTVALRFSSQELTLTVADNGRGFAADQIEESEGLGVAGMRERALLAGGHLDIISESGRGTKIFFRVEIDPDGAV